MADEREQGRQRECAAMGHVWPKRFPVRPARSTLRIHSTPHGWQDLYDHVEWTEACERCGKTAEVSVFLCETEGVELLRSEADVGMLVDDDHERFVTPIFAPRGVVSTLGPMKVVMRWGLATVNYQPRRDRG